MQVILFSFWPSAASTPARPHKQTSPSPFAPPSACPAPASGGSSSRFPCQTQLFSASPL